MSSECRTSRPHRRSSHSIDRTPTACGPTPAINAVLHERKPPRIPLCVKVFRCSRTSPAASQCDGAEGPFTAVHHPISTAVPHRFSTLHHPCSTISINPHRIPKPLQYSNFQHNPPKFLHGTLAQGCNTGFGRAARARKRLRGNAVRSPARWSSGVDDRGCRGGRSTTTTTPRQGEGGRDGSRRANGGLGEYYSERDTRTPVWLCAGDTRKVAELVGLGGGARRRAGPTPRWWRAGSTTGVAPNGASGRAFGTRGVHGFDLTFSAPKSVSLIRALTDDVGDKAIAQAHTDRGERGDGVPACACRIHPGAQPG